MVSAHASDPFNTVLCSGCATNAQFRAAGAASAGSNFVGTRLVLVVNPDTGDAMNVSVIWIPPPGSGVHPRAVHDHSIASSSVLPGAATSLESNPFTNVYVVDADGSVVDSTGRVVTNAGAHTDAGGASGSATSVSDAEKAEIDMVIALTKKTFVVRPPESDFPSYESSIMPSLAHYNYNALVEAVNGWPVSHISKEEYDELKKLIENYFGRDLEVCDVFANGDSACFIPNPFDPTDARQIGDAKDKNGNKLPDVASPVAGGGAGGSMQVKQQGSHFLYGAWDSVLGGGNQWLVCSYVGGKLTSCWIETQ
jgi:hypothetical protein